MAKFQSFRKAYGALKDTTKVGLAKVNSDYKDLDIAILKATSHVEYPPKERHVRKIIMATSVLRPRADLAYCIHTLSKRLAKTRSWIVAIKILIVIHRTLREGDSLFRTELLHYSHRAKVLQISNFKDDSSPLAWDCSAWVRTYALFLEERLECFRVLKYDIEAERPTKSPSSYELSQEGQCRTRGLSKNDLLEHLPALQQLLFRLVGCQPEGPAYNNYLIQYALALVLKESFKIYCAVNDGIINLVDMFFDMSRPDAVKALNIYKRAGKQAENLAEFYGYCKGLELARNFQLPTLRQHPPSFLATMEEYIKEAPQAGFVQQALEYHPGNEGEEEEEQEKEPSTSEEPMESEQVEKKEDLFLFDTNEDQPKEVVEPPQPVSTSDPWDLLGLNEVNPKAVDLEESNALALAILPPGGDTSASTNLGPNDFTGSGWELALVGTPSNMNSNNLAESTPSGGFDKLLLESLYEDDNARRQMQMTNAGYGYGEMATINNSAMEQTQDPFMGSNNFSPPTNVQMAQLAQQQQNMMNHQYVPQYPHEQMTSSNNPFGDPGLPVPSSSMFQQGNHMLL